LLPTAFCRAQPASVANPTRRLKCSSCARASHLLSAEERPVKAGLQPVCFWFAFGKCLHLRWHFISGSWVSPPTLARTCMRVGHRALLAGRKHIGGKDGEDCSRFSCCKACFRKGPSVLKIAWCSFVPSLALT
jgi:hypothetical protein